MVYKRSSRKLGPQWVPKKGNMSRIEPIHFPDLPDAIAEELERLHKLLINDNKTINKWAQEKIDQIYNIYINGVCNVSAEDAKT